MRRAERLFRLINEMRARGTSRSHELAAAMEVSVSTIYRDIAHLQASGVPIDGEAGVGYVLRPGFDLPNMTFSPEQIDALAMGLSFVEATGDAGLARAAREVRAKVQAELPDPEERRLMDAPFRSVDAFTDKQPRLGLLRDAIRKRKIVRFSYTTGSGNHSERRVHPLVVWALVDGWMFSGWCELRDDFRTFRGDRISDFRVTDDIFVEDDATGLRAFMARETC